MPPRRDWGRLWLDRQSPHALYGVDAVQRECLVWIHRVDMALQIEVPFHHLPLESVQESPHDLWVHALVLRAQAGGIPWFGEDIAEFAVAKMTRETRDTIVNLPDVGRLLARVDTEDLSQDPDVGPRELRQFRLRQKCSEQRRHNGEVSPRSNDEVRR